MRWTLLISLHLVARLAGACEEITVLSHDGKYMILDGDTLRVVDVGNLRWHGIWGVDHVLRGSTSQRFAFTTGRLSSELTRLGQDGFPKGALVVIENLAESLNTASRVAISHDYEPNENMWWINDSGLLGVWRPPMFTVLDKDLNELDAWTIADHAGRPVFGCLADEGLALGTLGHRVIRRNDRTMVDELAQPEDVGECRLFEPSLGCAGRIRCRRNGWNVHASVDIVRNELVASFEREVHTTPGNDIELPERRIWFSTRLLFAGGSRLLRQERVATLVPDTVGSREMQVRRHWASCPSAERRRLTTTRLTDHVRASSTSEPNVRFAWVVRT